MRTGAPPRPGLAVVLAVAALAACADSHTPPDQLSATPDEAVGLPADAQLPGWTRADEPQHFEADNLWEYINGEADFFLDYGFVRVDTAEYRSPERARSVVLEVYRMGRPAEAFGIFAAERTSDDREVEVGSGGYLGSNVLGFWRDVLYVKLTSFEEGEGVGQALMELATAVEAALPGEPGVIEALHLFPTRGRVRSSERFIPTSFLGQPYLNDAYRVDFVFGGEPAQLFIVEAGSPEQAAAQLERLAEFFRTRDREAVSVGAVAGLPTVEVDGPSKLVAFRLGHRLGGATGMHDLDTGRAAVAELAASMRR